MLFINATLSKNQLYKHQTNKQKPYHQQVRRHRVLFRSILHVILLISATCVRVILMVGF